MNKAFILKNKYYLLILGVTFFVGCFLRLYKLGEIPNGFYQDESAIGYNAYSIIKTGLDEYGKANPLYFKSFGDYKMPVYIYATTISVNAFGLNEFAVRFPSALFGFLTLPIFFLLVFEITKDRIVSIVSVGLLSINPWSLHYNRATFEVSIALFFFVFGTYLLFVGSRKKILGSFLFGVFSFIIAFYSYNLTRFLSPLLFICVVFFCRKFIKNINRKEILLTAIISFLVLLPFFASFMQSGGVNSAAGTLITTSSAVKAPLLEFRSYFVDTLPLLSKFAFNQLFLIIRQFMQNIASYFSVSFFFVSGSSHGNHGIGNFGLFYLFELGSILYGTGILFKRNRSLCLFFLSWVFTVIFVASLTRDVPHATRSFFLIFPLEVFSAIGIIGLYKKIKNINNYIHKYALFFLILMFCMYDIMFYFSSYYVRFPIFYAKQWREQDKAVSHFISMNDSKYDKIIFDTKAGFEYTSLLFYSKFNPHLFQSTVKREADDSEGFSKVDSFGKYEFRDVDWSRDYKLKRTLIVTTPDQKPNEVPPLAAYYYPIRPVVFAIGQKIVQYPISEIAYVLVETK